MKVVMVTGSLGDGAGGLASAVRGWAESLVDAGVDVTIFCLDLSQTFGANRLSRHSGVMMVEVPALIERRTRLILAPSLKKELRRHCIFHGCDVLHANGVWLPGTRIAARVARDLDLPFVVSPHGHLQPWAIKHRALKKSIAWFSYGRRSLENASLVQAASEKEASAVRALGIETAIAVVPNVVDIPRTLKAKSGKSPRTVLLLSRLHRSKGVLDLVDVWHRLRPSGWRVQIVGPDEGGHLSEVRARVREYDLDDMIVCTGPAPFESRWERFSEADLFVLPTYSENFGVTVAEALGAGVPVITTHAGPWQEIAARRCGWWVETGVPALEEALEEALAMSDEQREEMGRRGRQFIKNKFSASAVSRELLEAYRLAGVHKRSLINPSAHH